MTNKILAWAESHQTESIVIGGAVVIGVMYLLGFFSSGSGQSTGADPGTQSLAAAYYAAEAQQAVVGGQIQATQIAANASVANTAANANAAVAINAANANAATTLGAYGLGTTQSNNAALIATNAANNNAAVTTAYNAGIANETQTVLGTIVPLEMQMSGGYASVDLPGGQGEYFFDPAGPAQAITPAQMIAQGYSPLVASQYSAAQSMKEQGYTDSQIAQILGMGGPGVA